MVGKAKKASKKKKPEDAWAAYRGLGSELVMILKLDLEETKCCGLICLPGAFTRLAIARLINDAVDKRVKEERAACAAIVLTYWKRNQKLGRGRCFPYEDILDRKGVR